MAVISTRDYRNKKDFAAALEEAAGFDCFVVADSQGAERDVRGSWSTDRMARGESATLAMYIAIASKMAELDFRKFVGISGRFVVTAAKKAESDAGRNGKPSYYTEWQARDGEEYYIFRSLGNAAKYEQLWDWADGMGAELRLSYLTGDGAPERAERSNGEPDEETGEETGDEEIGQETGEDFKFSPVTARNCSVVTKDGKLCLYDNDAEKFITIPWDDAEGGVTNMLEFEPIRDPNSIGHSCNDDAGDGEDDKDGDGGAEPEGKLLGYRYRLEKDGPWGFISRRFSQSLSPRFSEFRTKGFDSECSLWGWGLSEETNDSGDRLLELWYTVERETQHEEQSDLVMNSALALARSWFDEANAHLTEENKQYCFRSQALPSETYAPGEEPFLRIVEDAMTFEGKRGADIVYAPKREGGCFVMSYMRSGEKRSFSSTSLLATEDHMIQYGHDRVMPFRGWSAFWRRNAFSCFDGAWLAGLPWHERGALKYLSGNYYAVRRDGYWAVMEEEDRFGDSKTYIRTPYAFTEIEPLKDQDGRTRNCFLVERFGKRGALKVLEVFLDKFTEYPVPCDYESIQLTVDEDGVWIEDEARGVFYPGWKGRFLVSRMGFKGEINSDGSWRVHLHREEDAQEGKQKEESSISDRFGSLFIEDDGEGE